MKSTSIFFAGMLLCGVSSVALASVTASLDQSQVGNGQSVVLTLQKDSSGGGDPDLTPLKKDFDVLGTSSSSNVQIDNGHISTQRVLQLTLSPKHSGTLQIPALAWDGETSQPLSLVVSNGGGGRSAAGGGSSAATGAHIFITSTLDQQQPYVQAGVVLTVQLHTDQPLYHASMDFSGDSDVLVRQLGKDQRSAEVRDGHQYNVIERKYLLQPQRSGRLNLDGPTLDAQVADTRSQDPFAGVFGGNSPFSGMLGTTRPIRLHGDAITLDVRPRPAAASGRDWLPATQVTLEESLKPDNASVRAGDPLTLHLHLSAQGVTGAQLPDLSAELSLPDGLKAYPDQAKLATNLQSGGVVGSRDQDIALIADQAGQYQIPALRLTWWDTAQNQQRVAELPARTLTILPATGANPVPPPPALIQPAAPVAAAASKPPAMASIAAHEPAGPLWRWVSLSLGLLWLLTLLMGWLLWRRARATKAASGATSQPVTAAPDSANARKVFQSACRGHDPQTARRELLRWARGVMTDSPPAGLNALARHLKNPRVAELLAELDRACYAGMEWQGDALAAALTSLPVAIDAKSKTPRLAELYP
ncbi:MAG: BatD family protein [Stenotrophobium sp.]